MLNKVITERQYRGQSNTQIIKWLEELKKGVFKNNKEYINNTIKKFLRIEQQISNLLDSKEPTF